VTCRIRHVPDQKLKEKKMTKNIFKTIVAVCGLTASLAAIANGHNTISTSVSPAKKVSHKAKASTPPVQNTSTSHISGFYALAQGGYNFTSLASGATSPVQLDSYRDFTIHNVSKLKHNGFTARLALGYQLNKNLAFDVGYLYLPTINASYHGKYSKPSDAGIKVKGSADLNAKLTRHAFDLRAKGILPLNKSTNLYGFTGAAYEKATTTVSLANATRDSDGSADTEMDKTYFNSSSSYIRPELGGGLGYRVSPNMEFTAEYTYIFGTKNGNHVIAPVKSKASTVASNHNTVLQGVPAFNSIMLGLQYTF